ncbi:MAG: DUF433 domain-containing protein [bacterium]
MNNYPNIISDINILGGKPVIKGTRISVEMILEWISSGASMEDMVKAYPHLSIESLKEGVKYATEYLKNEILVEIKTVS